MKKFFLPLLALVGMVAGFTLCSCGGGGGNNDGPARAMANMKVELGSTPWIAYDFQDAITSHALNVLIYAGDNSSGPSVSPTLTARYFIVDCREDADYWHITGDVSFSSVVNQMQDNKEFLAYVGVPSASEQVVLDGYRVQFSFPKASGSKTGKSVTQLSNGKYWVNDDGEGTEIEASSKACETIITGELKTQYLKGEGSENGDSDLWIPGTI